MKGYIKRRVFTSISFMFIIAVVLVLSSCSPKVYPSGVEPGLNSSSWSTKKNQFKRKHQARSLNREMRRNSREQQRSARMSQKQFDRELERFRKKHMAMQHSDVQQRMKLNQKEDKKRNRSNQTFLESLFTRSTCP